jgi:Tol biopolymer transport system component
MTGRTGGVFTARFVGLLGLLLAVGCGSTPPAPPAALSSVSVSPASVQGGTTSTGTVTLTGAAPEGGTPVALLSSNESATVPASVTVAAGAATATFAVRTSAETADPAVTITASYAGVSRTVVLAITPPPPPVALLSVAVSPASVEGGASSTGTVTLAGAAPAGGAVVSISSSLQGTTVPAVALVPAGEASTTFPIGTSTVLLDTATTITVGSGGETRTAVLTITSPPIPLRPCPLRAPGAQWLGFSSRRSGEFDLYAVRADGTCLTRLTGVGGDELFVTWSPAGTFAYMSSRSGTMRIYVQDFDSRLEAALPVGDLGATSPAFSPDGTLVAFEGYAAGVTDTSDVYVVPAAGGAPVKLTSGTGYNAGPAWSPDGSQIYFVSNRTGRYDVWKVAAAGGTETQVTTASGILGRPAASPDGTGIAFTRPAPGAAFSEVVIQDLATSAIRIVSSQADGEPAFDRTGARVVVTSFRGGDADPWLLDVATGAAVRQLTAEPGMDGSAAFAPFP